MNKIGLIGYGSMGSMLVKGFINSEVIKPENMIVSTATKDKLNKIQNNWKKIQVTGSNIKVAKNAKYIIICVKPSQVKKILDEIKENINKEQVIVSIAACVTINNIEQVINGKVIKVIPTLLSEVDRGISLICYNSQINKKEKAFIENIFNSISKVKIIKENNFEIAADFTSCAPGLFAAIFQEFVESGLKHSSFSRKEVEEMVLQTFFGTAKLLEEKSMSFEDTISRVATEGGITQEGVKVIEEKLPVVFNNVFEKTLNKHKILKNEIKKDYK